MVVAAVAVLVVSCLQANNCSEIPIHLFCRHQRGSRGHVMSCSAIITTTAPPFERRQPFLKVYTRDLRDYNVVTWLEGVAVELYDRYSEIDKKKNKGQTDQYI